MSVSIYVSNVQCIVWESVNCNVESDPKDRIPVGRSDGLVDGGSSGLFLLLGILLGIVEGGLHGAGSLDHF